MTKLKAKAAVLQEEASNLMKVKDEYQKELIKIKERLLRIDGALDVLINLIEEDEATSEE